MGCHRAGWTVSASMPFLLLAALFTENAAGAAALRLKAADYGLIADGAADDGPAIARLLAEARGVKGPVALIFPENGTVRVTTSPERYVFPLDGVAGLELDGGGCLFLLNPYLRFMRLAGSRGTTVRNLKVDFDPLPFVEGTVTEADAAGRFLGVKLRPGQGDAPSGGPTREDGEQAFFSMLWHDGPYGTVSEHCWTENIEKTGDGTLRVHCGDSFHGFEKITPGVTRISVPVPGIAHRFGPGACFQVRDNTDALFEDVELWSAPWFGFELLRNGGALTFRRVHLRPRPGSGRWMSLWRDGFHVKGNSAALRWEDCEVFGMNDDAFNISTHASTVRRVEAPDWIVVSQAFPLGYVPWRESGMLAAADRDTGRLFPTRRIVKVEEGPPRVISDKPAAPGEIALTLEAPAPELAEGVMVWDPEQANPDTLLKNCVIGMSCRMQSPVRMEGCDVTALLWFYCEHLEGPFPSGVRITDCTLRRGRGNPDKALIFSGQPKGNEAAPPRAIHDIVIENSRIYGGVAVEGVENARITGNRFLEAGAAVVLRGNHGVAAEGNLDAEGNPLEPR
ncbi:MAG: right-handed parallel beta-helix repeat-containing protein [Candidatus Hydrogenedens sp.]|nr:right-handed parallel beta-helix repeat-containing protein [Candidatus Hydrogenedens sp.]